MAGASRQVDSHQLEVLRGALRVASRDFPDDDLESASRRFLEILTRPKCHSLSLGYVETFVLFGPPYVSGRFVMMPGCVTDRSASRRGVDFLQANHVPHVTVGRFNDGCGVERGGGLHLEWHISSPPVWREDLRGL